MNDRRWRKGTPEASRIDQEKLMHHVLWRERAVQELSAHFEHSAPMRSP